MLLIHGVGPSVADKLPYKSLEALCDDILVKHGSLAADSCLAYMENISLRKMLPLCNVDMLAASIAPTATRHLHYLDKPH